MRTILPTSCVLSNYRQAGGARLIRHFPGSTPQVPLGEEPLSAGHPSPKELDVKVGDLVDGDEAASPELDQ